MYKNKKILAIIPARGGSKRIKNKNLVLLAGKPLIQYTFEQAKSSKYINRIVVSTDDNAISNFSKKNNIEVIKRPKELARDSSSTILALQHVVSTLIKTEDYKPDFIVLLQPTSPLRNKNDIDLTIKELLKKKVDSAETFCLVENHPAYMVKIIDGKPIPLFKKDFLKRSQDLPKIYRENGAVFVVKTDILMKKHTLYGKNHKAVLMPVDGSIDIDYPLDLKIAEVLIENAK
jgi:CMP-N-acetylneuraminic acid synthetase